MRPKPCVTSDPLRSNTLQNITNDYPQMRLSFNVNSNVEHKDVYRLSYRPGACKWYCSSVIPGHLTSNTCNQNEYLLFAKNDLPLTVFLKAYSHNMQICDVCYVLFLRVLEITPVQMSCLHPSKIPYQIIYTMMLFLRVHTIVLDDSWDTKCVHKGTGCWFHDSY